MSAVSSSSFVSALRRVNKKTMQHPRVRRFGIAAYRTGVRGIFFLPGPRVLLNGPSKSGTHLLSDCVALLPRMMFSGRHFGVVREAAQVKRPAQAFSLPSQRHSLGRFLARCPNGMFVTAHADHDPWMAETLAKLEFRHILLLRDPRDVVVSRAFFRKRLPWHPHHRYFTEVLKTDAERIMATIEGFPAQPTSPVPLESINDAFRRYLSWFDSQDLLTVRFEDLVGPVGGGQLAAQLNAVRKIADHIGRPIDDDEVVRVADRMYATSGLTYRKGVAGDWRNHFTDEHRAVFDRVSGDLLEVLGYGSCKASS